MEVIEIYGVKIDPVCAGLLKAALEAPYPDERKMAIRKLAELGCGLALGVVAAK